MPFTSYLTSLPADDALAVAALSGSVSLIAFALFLTGVCALGSLVFGRLAAPNVEGR